MKRLSFPTFRRGLAPSLTALVLLFGCAEADDRAAPVPDAGAVDVTPEDVADAGGGEDTSVVPPWTCSSCHGGEDNFAPPAALGGATETTERGVGAHQAHLAPSDRHRAVACDECHVVPSSLTSEGHVDTDLPAELVWGALATADGAAPSWDGERCASTYCHGGTFAGGQHTAPRWTLVDGSQAGCASCHAFPPPAPHPQSPACASCHPTVDAAGAIVDGARHVDGVVDLAEELACDACHGGGGVSAPPLDLAGNDDTSARGVGAHRSHLGPSDWHAEVACAECHTVPTEQDAPGHVDSAPPAELVWGALASSRGAEPSWDGERCASTYCHGATLDAGGSLTAPEWTKVNGSQAACGTCHGAPPAPPHTTRIDCAACHPTMGPGAEFTAPERHIDGQLDLAEDTACDACHGSDGNPAPPRDIAGNTATSARGVGAHRAHFGPSDWHAEVGCGECHTVPTRLSDTGHVDSELPAELVWGPLASADGATPAWDGARCSSTYCHGGTLEAGGNVTAPEWTTVDGSQATCGACHTLPPPAPHPAQENCSNCHGRVIDADRNFVDPTLHIDGDVQMGGR